MTELEKRIRAVLWPVETAEDTFKLAMEAAKIATEIERERCATIARREMDSAARCDERVALSYCIAIRTAITDPEAK